MQIIGEIFRIEQLESFHKNRMFELMDNYFENMDRKMFDNDLYNKQWVIILFEHSTGEIKGFSSLMEIDMTIEEETVKLIFSGDTIINRKCWGKTELHRIFGQFTLSLKEKYKDKRIFWLLISMGYKTYRFLPVYFRDFYPRYDKETPVFEKRIIDTFGLLKYPHAYNERTGVISLPDPKPFLKPGVADIEERLLRDPHIAFFDQKNPQHIKGDEIVCVAELCKENLSPIAYKILIRTNRNIPVVHEVR